MASCLRLLVLPLCLLLLSPVVALASGVQALFDLSSPAGGPFPSDRFTVPDASHNTGLRVSLPKPNCAMQPSDCADIDIINTVDGFNMQPRLAIPFSGAIDVASVNSGNVFLVGLGDALTGAGAGKVVGISQIVWDPVGHLLYAESDEMLDQHSRWVLIVTNGVRDAEGDPVEAGAFATFKHDLNFGQTKDKDLKAYRKALKEALEASGVDDDAVVVASVFSTQSATADLEKIRDQIKAAALPIADFLLGPGGSRTLFPLGTVTSMTFNRQVLTVGPFSSTPVPVTALNVVPGSVGAVAFGRYNGANYETVDRYIPAVGTRTGTPAVQSVETIYFNLFLPSTAKPTDGWPVAIFGHGFGDNKNNSPFIVASILASRGIATIAINVVGHGFGTASTLTVNRSAANGGPVTFRAGSRGFDQNNSGSIDSTEGVNAAPLRAIIGSRDGLRQTVIDLVSLTRMIEGGVDVDSDGMTDLDPSRIYYFGQSFGGIYGVKFIAIEPSVRFGVPNVAGGPIIHVARLGGFRPLVALSLGARVPSLLNGGASGFTENIPLRDEPPVTNPVFGALAIQEVIENTEWVTNAGNPVAYAPHIRKAPLAGQPEKTIIFQFAKGDQTVPNPTATAILRAGDLADRATYYRNDLAFMANPATPKNPHTFLTNVGSLQASVRLTAAQGQAQIADFFETEGMVNDPDGSGTFFETPVVLPLPEGLNFIP